VEVSYCTSPIVSSIPDTDGSTYDSDSESGSAYEIHTGWYLIFCTDAVIFFFPFFHSQQELISLPLSICLSKWVLSFLALATSLPLLFYGIIGHVRSMNLTSSAEKVAPVEQ
jgi:hypothetical protein